MIEQMTVYKEIPKFLNVQIQTTSFCNGRCKMCPYLDSWHHNNPGKMNDGLFDKIIKDLKNFKIGKFCLYLENEPLMDHKLLSRIEKSLSLVKCEVFELSTNANPKNFEFFRKLINLMGRWKKSELWISFHGTSKETYEHIMGISFSKALKNTISLLKLAQETTNIKVVLRGAGQAIISPESMPFHFSEKEYLKFWNKIFKKEKIKTENVEIRYIKYHDRAGSIARNEYNYKKTFRNHLKDFYCPRIDQWIHILYNGDVIICCNDYHREVVFGNLNKQNIAEIFSSDEYREVKDILSGRSPVPNNFLCLRCNKIGG